jgi:type III secretory pathway component EscR
MGIFELFPIAIVILCTGAFVKFLAVLGILKFGLGLEGLASSIVATIVSFVLAVFVVEHQLGSDSVRSLLSGSSGVNTQQFEKTIEPRLLARTDQTILKRFETFAGKIEKQNSKPIVQTVPSSEVVNETSTRPSRTFSTVAAAYLISEMRDAFLIGIMILLPFFVIDIIVGNTLAALAVTQLSTRMVATPLKLLLFVAVDGWRLLAERLIGAYGG